MVNKSKLPPPHTTYILLYMCIYIYIYVYLYIKSKTQQPIAHSKLVTVTIGELLGNAMGTEGIGRGTPRELHGGPPGNARGNEASGEILDVSMSSTSKGPGVGEREGVTKRSRSTWRQSDRPSLVKLRPKIRPPNGPTSFRTPSFS